MIRPSHKTLRTRRPSSTPRITAWLLVGAWLLAGVSLLPGAVHAEPADAELERVFEHLEFLQGSWIGNGFGGTTEEHWLPPRDGQMLGVFRLVGGTMPPFSEILSIGRFEGQIELRLKHFDDQLHGWEEKNDVVSFPFESSESGKVVFRGLAFQKAGDDELRIELKLRNGEQTWTEVFEFERPSSR